MRSWQEKSQREQGRDQAQVQASVLVPGAHLELKPELAVVEEEVHS